MPLRFVSIVSCIFKHHIVFHLKILQNFIIFAKMDFSSETGNDLVSRNFSCLQGNLIECHSYVIHKDTRHTHVLSIGPPLKLLVDENNAGEKTLIWAVRPYKKN